MSANLDKLINRLHSFQAKNVKSNLIWKPEAGSQIVRIVPYKFDPENPFIELQFYYGLQGKTYLSPATFGKPDPIVEFCTRLKKSGSREDWLLARKAEPKLRTYAPILVRGQEDQGVKYWGFGKMVYQDILKIMADPDYGDITDLLKGHDIAVEFQKAAASVDGKSFPKTTIRAKPSKTPAVDPKRQDLVERLNNQTDISTLFTLPSYDELKQVMHSWLNPEADDATVDVPDDATVVEPDPSAELIPVVSPSAEKAESESPDEDYSKKFEDFWKSGKKTS